MQKFQLGLIAMLICCVAFVSCERTQKMMAPAEPTADTMPADMTDMMDSSAEYASWISVALPAPGAFDATSPAEETGGAHGMGTRTVYINEAGVTALKDATMATFPAGTAIAKEIMDDTNTFVFRLAMMMKTADEMYASHGGWQYVQYQRETADAELMPQAGDIPGGSSDGCHSCHAKATTDSVFVKLPAEMMMEMTEGDDGDTDADGDTGDMTDGMETDMGGDADMTGDADGDMDGDADMTGDADGDMDSDMDGDADMNGDADMTGDANGATGDGADSTEDGDGDTGAATNGGDTTENGGTTDNAGAAGN